MTTLLTGGSPRSRQALDDDVDLARDRVLVTRAQAGDRSAFDDLYLRYYRRLYRFCLRRLHDPHEAEDVAQESFARAWRALPTFGGDRRFYPWLSVIASHLCTDVLRRRSRSTPVAEFHQGNVASTEDGGEERVIAAVDSALVAKAFERLSDRHQRILNLREGSGWSYQRIADHEGVGITAVETLLWRARQALKREFASLNGAEGRGAVLAGAGLFSLATLRKLLGAPAKAARRVAHFGPGTALAVGSAAAATAFVLGAAGGAPAAPPPAPSAVTVAPVSTGAPHLLTPASRALGAASVAPGAGSAAGTGGPGGVGGPSAPGSDLPGPGGAGTALSTVGASGTAVVGNALGGLGDILGGTLQGLQAGGPAGGIDAATTAVGQTVGGATDAAAKVTAAVAGSGPASALSSPLSALGDTAGAAGSTLGPVVDGLGQAAAGVAGLGGSGN